MNNSSSNHSIEQSFVSFSANQAALIFVMATVGTFLMTGALQYYYYLKVFEDVVQNIAFMFAILIPFIIQSVRFAFLMATSKHFSHGHKGKGFFTLIGSVGVTAFCGYEMQELALTWGAQFPQWSGSLFLIFEFLVWGGFVLELGLLIAVAGAALPEEEYVLASTTGATLPQEQPAIDAAQFNQMADAVATLAKSVRELQQFKAIATEVFQGNGVTS